MARDDDNITIEVDPSVLGTVKKGGSTDGLEKR